MVYKDYHTLSLDWTGFLGPPEVCAGVERSRDFSLSWFSQKVSQGVWAGGAGGGGTPLSRELSLRVLG